MATPEDFMRRVIPWPGDTGPGYVNLHWTALPKPGDDPKKKGMRGRPYKNLEDFMSMAQWLAGKPAAANDIYFCLSVQSMTGKVYNGQAVAARGKHFAMSLKAIWLDIDIGKDGHKGADENYETGLEATLALEKFCTDAAIPPPSAVILSGGGMHVYWISDKPLPVAEWELYAAGLASEVIRLGFKADVGLTTDCARVLRVPGTFNRKIAGQPRTVRLAGKPPRLGQDYDFATSSLARLRGLAKPVVTAAVNAPAFDLSGFSRPPAAFAKLNPLGDNIADGLQLTDTTPLDPKKIFEQCPHFWEAIKTGGAGYNQGLWMLDVLAMTFVKDPEMWARGVSRGHKDYSKDDFKAMFDRKAAEKKAENLGWPGCLAFERNGCKSCVTCPLRGTIKSPLSLADRVQQDVVLPPVSTHVQEQDAAAELHLPEGYILKDGVINRICEEKVGTEVKEEPYPMFHCKIELPWADRGPPSSLNWRAYIGIDEVEPVQVTDEQMALNMSLVVALCKQRCKPVASMERHLVSFMRSWCARIDEHFKRMITAPYGWLFENGKTTGFAYGGKVFKDTGLIEPTSYADPVIQKGYMPVGGVGPYYDLLKIICDQHHPALEICTVAGWAGPLMMICGESNGILWAKSDGSGAHKSTSLNLAASTWGNHKLTKDNTSASMLGIQKKLGTLHNIPVFIDEIRDDAQVDALRMYSGVFTEGGTGPKLKSNREFHQQLTWQSMMIVGSNQSMRDNMVKHIKSTDAALRRVFEFTVEKRADTVRASDAAKMQEELTHNFGQVGLAYSQYLGLNHEAIMKEGTLMMNAFNDEVGLLSEERFWGGLCAAIIFGAVLANRVLPQPYFHVDEIREFMKEALMENRSYMLKNTQVGGTVRHAGDILMQFIKANVAHQLWTQDMVMGPGRKSVTWIGGVSRNKPDQVHIHWCVNDRLVDISKTEFERFLDLNKYANTPVQVGLRDHFNAEWPKNPVNLVAGMGIVGQGAESIIRLPVPVGSPLESVLLTHSTAEERAAAPGSEAAGSLFDAALLKAQSDMDLVKGAAIPQDQPDSQPDQPGSV